MKLRTALLFILFSMKVGHATLDRSSVIAELESLYPHLSHAQMSEKIHSAKTRFEFLKSFVPYFYLISKELKADHRDKNNTLTKISKEVGWCLGDAHPKNFGIILNSEAQAEFRVNDADDFGPCPLYLDFMRFLVASSFYESRLDEEFMADLFNNYKSGLTASPHKLSATTQKFIETYQDQPLSVPNHMLESQKRLLRFDPDDDMNTRDKEKLTTIVENFLGEKLKLLDAIKFMPHEGGSSHLLRYRLLVKFGEASFSLPNEAPRKQLLELKTITLPGVFPVYDGDIPPAQERLNQNLSMETGRYSRPLVTVLKVHQCEMLLRPRWSAEASVDLESLTLQQLQAVLKDEAYVIGRFHSRSASEDYIEGVKKSSPESWLNDSSQLQQRLTKRFEILQ